MVEQFRRWSRPVMPECSTEDVGEEMSYLESALGRPLGPEGARREPVDLARALLAAGATPGEAVSYTHLTLPTICSV
eukprot:8362267-Alexandrium_andersonii.AAC.1